MSSEEILFKTAVDAVENSERQRARDLLTRLLKINRENPEYWLWMSAVVESPKESIFCLKEAIKLDPENQAARRGLIMAGQLPIDEKMVIPIEKQRQDWQSNMFSPPSRWQKFMQAPLWMRIGSVGGAFVLLVAIVYLAAAGIGKINFSAGSGKENLATLDLPRFSAATPTPGTQQPTATFSGPTPLAILLVSTYTPTPIYVNTPHPSTENYRSAIRAYHRGDLEAMLNFIEQAIPFEPDAPDLHYYTGEAYRLMEDFELAEESYLTALEKDPDFAPAYLGLGLVLLAEDPGNIVKAKIEMRKAIKLDPNFLDAYLTLTQIGIEEANYRIAEVNLDQAEQIAPDSPYVALYRGQLLLQQDQPNEALLKALEAHHLDTTMLPAYRLLGEIYLKLEDPRNAAANLNTYTLYITNDPEALTWLAQAHWSLQEYDLGLDAVNLALQLDPQYYPALIARGEFYLTQDKGFLAVNDFLEAQELQPKSFEVLAGLGRAYLLENVNRLAYNRLSNALDSAEDDSQLAAAYYWRAQSLEKLQELRSARQDWQAFLNLDEENIPQEWLKTAEEHLERLYTPTRTPRVTGTRTPTRTKTATPLSRTASPTP